MYFVFDLETSGLPQFTPQRGYYDPKCIEKYASSRIVSISWIILDKNLEVLDKNTFIISPEGFVLNDPVNIAIHGITDERAHAEGVPFRQVVDILRSKAVHMKTLVAHNVNFDFNVLSSECIRFKEEDLAVILAKSRKYCTMVHGKLLLSLPKNPKLKDLYEMLYETHIEHEHDAEYDTYHCCMCFKILKYIPPNNPDTYRTYRKRPPQPTETSDARASKNPTFFFDQKPVNLTSEQSEVVFAKTDNRASLVVACAGSGKTTVIVCRIKHLVDAGVPEDSIVLTTFTRDAANDMEDKLTKVFGYKPKIQVGTIDSLALKCVQTFKPEWLNATCNNVGEYAVHYLKLLKSEVAHQYFDKIHHLFVDEFQDINELQYKIIKQFYKQHVTINAVGDDAQNIYTFRGSDVKYIINFQRYFVDGIVYKLTTNFRSSKDIVAFANATIEKNEFQIPKTMVAFKEYKDSNKPRVTYFGNNSCQYEYIRDKIIEYSQQGVSLCQMAVLCPQNSYLFQIEEVLAKSGIHHILLEGKGDVRTNIRADHVCLTTIHKSKGLEWDVVFLMHMNDAIFPSRKDYLDICESRRLFYVAVTRPRKVLHLTFAPAFNCHCVCRFVSEVDKSLLQMENVTENMLGVSLNDWGASSNQNLAQRIGALQGKDYITMKDLGIMPEFHQETSELYENCHAYPGFIIENDMQSDFTVFLHILLNRMMGETHTDSGGLFYKPAMMALYCLKLSYEENVVYQKYKHSFTHNLCRVATQIKEYSINDMCNNMRQVLSMFLSTDTCSDIRPIESQDVSVIFNMLTKLKKKSEESGIPMDAIPMFTEKFLPGEFETSLRVSMNAFKDKNFHWADIIHHVWEVSKCQAIVLERRRRLLYKDVKRDDIISCMALYDDMWRSIVCADALATHGKAQGAVPQCNLVLTSSEPKIATTVNLLYGNAMYKYVGGNDERIKAEDLLELLVCKELHQATREDNIVEYIGVINPQTGRKIRVDVREYKGGGPLIDFIYPKAVD